MYVHLMILWKLHYINFCGNNNDDGDDDDDDNIIVLQKKCS